MLKDSIMNDIIQSMKNKDALQKGVLQLVKAAIENFEIEKKRLPTTAEEIQIVQREVKQTKDALAEAEKYNRLDLVDENKRKLDILYGYLPKQLNEDEVRHICITLEIKQGMNMGEAMKIAMPVLSGKTENALVSKVVKELIS